jgi:hypothetical protein
MIPRMRSTQLSRREVLNRAVEHQETPEGRLAIIAFVKEFL